MRRRPRFLVDVDEVLADFQGPALQVMMAVTGRTIRREDFEVWDLFTCLSPEEEAQVHSIIEQPGYCASLRPFPEAQRAIAHLRRSWDVYAVTSPFHSRHWVYERDRWLKKHFGMDRSHIIHTASKYMVRGEAYLDDRPDSVERWQSEHPTGLAMLWHLPNTTKLGLDDIRVRSWDEVVARLDTAT